MLRKVFGKGILIAMVLSFGVNAYGFSSELPTTTFNKVKTITGNNTAIDNETNQDSYEFFMEQGIDITQDMYKVMMSGIMTRGEHSNLELFMKLGLVPEGYDIAPPEGLENEPTYTVDWDRKVTRGDYAKIINRFVEIYNIPNEDCCMGTSPDLSQTPTTSKYYEDIKKASLSGFYCTANGSDESQPLLERELVKYLWKWTKEIVPYNGFRNYGMSDIEAYNNLAVNNDCIGKESQVTIDMVVKLSQYNMLPLDKYLNRMCLNKELTLRDLANILIGTGDLMLFYRDENLDTRCYDCALLNVDKYYDEVFRRAGIDTTHNSSQRDE